MPQARNATSTTAANGFADHEPNDADDRGRHRVDVAARRRPRRDRDARASTANALRITSAPTLSSAIQIARGTWRAASLRLLGRADAGVEADEHPAADGERGEHPGADRAAGERLGAERVRRGARGPASRKTSSSASPIPTDATTSAAMPDPDRAAEHVDAERADDRADDDEQPSPVTTIALGVGVDAEQRQRPRRAEVGDRRVRHRVGADRHPAAEPAVGRRRSAGGSTGRRRRRSGTPRPARSRPRAAGTARRARPAAPTPTPGPATSVPTSTTA